MTTVTALIPCYNAEAYLAEAIEGVLAQTRAPDEILVVDDCSTDGSRAVAERFASRGVRLLSTPRNGGGSVARNVGIRAASGEIIASCDADDRWEPDHLSTVVGLLERHPEAAVAFSRIRWFGGPGWGDWPVFLAENEPADAFLALMRSNIVPHPAQAFRRHAVLAVGGYDEALRTVEDWDLWLRVARRHPFVASHRITVNYRSHPGQVSKDVRPLLTVGYRSRHEAWRAAAREQPALGARAAEVFRAAWNDEMTAAWQQRDDARFAFLLEMAALVPGSEGASARWRRNWRLLWPVRSAAIALGRPLVRAARRLVGRRPRGA